jgi:hypothetical protein
MRPHTGGRASACGPGDAQIRLRHAESFLLVAELVLEQPDDPLLALTGVAASLAVLAGIAASDAACCAAIRQRSRGQNHEEAINLVRAVSPGGEKMARDLGRLLSLKDNAQYGVVIVSKAQAESAVGWARRLVEQARDVVSVRP